MHRSLILLLFVSTVFAQQRKPPDAVWQLTPMPHWHCEAGMVPTTELAPLPEGMTTPQCIAPAVFSRHWYFYDAQTQEAVHFAKDVVITNQGTVAVEWSPLFLHIPGCQITGDEKHHIDFGEQSRERMVIVGRPKQKLHLKCTGIVKR